MKYRYNIYNTLTTMSSLKVPHNTPVSTPDRNHKRFTPLDVDLTSASARCSWSRYGSDPEKRRVILNTPDFSVCSSSPLDVDEE